MRLESLTGQDVLWDVRALFRVRFGRESFERSRGIDLLYLPGLAGVSGAV